MHRCNVWRQILTQSIMEHRLEQLKPSAVHLTTLAGAALRFSEQLKAGQSRID